jgi:hemolysin D
VEKEMPAEVKIHTFPFTKYGVIDAEVENISDDAIYDEKRGFTYSMLLAMKEKTIAVEGREVQLMPGMEVTAEIKTGERRLIEYFLAPLLRHGKESLRER